MNSIPDYTISRSHRRTVSLHITPEGRLLVKAPFFVPSYFIRKFVEKHRVWIAKQVSNLHQSSNAIPKGYLEGENFLFLGNKHSLRFKESIHEIILNNELCFPSCLQFRIKKELTDWYVKQAKKIISERVNYFSSEMDTRYKKIGFSDTKSKWGSCGRDNSLQFNWHLVMAPLLVVDYVVVHELAHTFEKNHSRKFWKIVEKYKPAYRQYRSWLKNNGAVLNLP